MLRLWQLLMLLIQRQMQRKKETEEQKEPFKPTEMMLGIYSMLQDSGMSQADINQMDLVLFFKTLAYKKKQEDKNVVRTANQAPDWL